MMSFEADGFLSPEIDNFRDAVNSESPSKEWFEFAGALNRACHEVLCQLSVPQTNNEPALVRAALLLRALQSYQAALVLAERGMTGDARAVLRTAVEGVIAIHALAASPAFLDRLEGQDQANQRVLAMVVSDEPALMAGYTPDERRQIEALSREKNDKPKINWCDEAKSCPGIYPLLYRLLSTGGTHTNLDTIGRHLEKDANGHPTGVRGGPDLEGIASVLRIATEVAFLAIEPFVKLAATDVLGERFQGLRDRRNALPET